MKARIKHIILTLCMLVSFNQSIHIASHIFSSHDSSKSELVHLNDHKCQLCQIDVQTILDDSDIELFSWNEIPKQHSTYFYISKPFYPIASHHFYLRGPPNLI